MTALPRLSPTAFCILIAVTMVAVTVAVSAIGVFSADEMYVVWPVLVCCSVYIMFFYVLWSRIRASVFGEIGFIYLGLALAYTVLPAATVIVTNFVVPIGLDGSSPVILYPEPAAVGAHFWRHAVFISGVAVGYMTARGRASSAESSAGDSRQSYGDIIIMVALLLFSAIAIVTLLSAPVSTYYEHYTRYEHLSSPLLKLVQFSLIVKSGSYFVLMALMFSKYEKYKFFIFLLVPILCIYEILYSFGSRIEALTILIAFAGYYHYQAKPISLRIGLVYLVLLASLFSAVELVRSAQLNEQTVESMAAEEGIKSASEFGAVFNTGFHLYTERGKGSLPAKEWPMFVYEIISLVPFVNHTEYHPQYWYARNYFPSAIVPPQTMGVISDSAIWGGEIDLLLRSLINGAIFAYLTRWFIRRRKKWWAISIYVYMYATCIMTLKYSVFYQLPMLIKILLPVLLLTWMLFRFKKSFFNVKREAPNAGSGAHRGAIPK